MIDGVMGSARTLLVSKAFLVDFANPIPNWFLPLLLLNGSMVRYQFPGVKAEFFSHLHLFVIEPTFFLSFYPRVTGLFLWFFSHGDRSSLST